MKGLPAGSPFIMLNYRAILTGLGQRFEIAL